VAGTSFGQTTPPTYTVNAFAGEIPLGNGGPAASAFLSWPGPLLFDRAGNLYVADQGNASVRKVTPDGIITNVAGTGQAGFSGDGGPASQAQVSSTIMGLAIDAGGNLYISDGGNNRVRRVSAADGAIGTFVDGSTLGLPTAATGFLFLGIAFDSAGNLYLAMGDFSGRNRHPQILRIAPDGTSSVFAGTGASGDTGDGGPAAQATFELPFGLYIDASGAMYVSDNSANRVRRITPDGIIGAFPGTGGPGFLYPSHIGGDAGGNLYVVDYGNFRVVRIAANGAISTLVGNNGNNGVSGLGGPASQAGLSASNGVAVSPAGDIYISTDDYAVLKVGAADSIVNLAFGRRHFAPDGAHAANAALDRFTFALASDSQGNFYLGDGNTVRKIDTDHAIYTIAGQERTGTEATSIVVNAGDGGPATAASIQNPVNAIAVDAAGNVYFSAGGGEDPISATVRRIGADGAISTVAGSAGLSDTIDGLAIDSSGSLYVSDTGNHQILKVTAGGSISLVAGTGNGSTSGDGGPATRANIQQPYGLAFDAAGNLYFADRAANRVREITPKGIISTFAGTGRAAETGDGGSAADAGLNGPSGLAIDPAGNVYIADYFGDALRVVTPDGIIDTIAKGQPEDAWDWVCSYGGDGGPAMNAHYSAIAGVALDGSGNIYVVDNYNERIRILTPTTQPQIAGVGVSGGGANIAQNAWVEIYGANLAPASVGAGGLTWSNAPSFASGQMPTQLQGVSVTVNGNPAYIYFISPTQVNVLTPLDSTTGAVAVEVNNGSAISAAFTANLQPVAPGFLRFGDGVHVAALHANYSYLGPASMSAPGYTFTPAAPGETILLFGDGFGLPVSMLTAGSDVQTGALPSPWPRITIGGATATVQYAGLISPGLYQLNVVAPSTAADGDNQVIAYYAGVSSPTGAMIPVSH
jgi:uncharacterized protein (TIGR03437 family)